MALKLNKNRTYQHPVSVSFYDENGKIITGAFNATFRVMNADMLDQKETRFIDQVLVAVDGLELTDEHGNILEGAELLEAVKGDGDLANACMEAYNESIEKKRTKKKISAK